MITASVVIYARRDPIPHSRESTVSNVVFPAGFTFGTATSAYQIEGAVAEDGRAPSIWDTFSAIPGKVATGESGDPACDHYHRWPEDVALLSELGVSAYRFSIAWPRVQPTGDGALNPAGVDFYSRLVDALLERGITPWVTLYHWDLPQALQDKGGWINRDTAYRFAEYAGLMAERLGDRVRHWITLNEPFVSATAGYQTGRHAPGERLGDGAFAATHHLLLSHGLAVPVLRERLGSSAQVGITLDLSGVVAASDSTADQEAARRYDAWKNRIYTDPVLRGEYPKDLDEVFPQRPDPVRDGDLELIAAPLDFLGINYYTPKLVAAGDGPAGADVLPWRDHPVDDMGFADAPETFGELLRRLVADYPGLPPLVITENGVGLRSEPATTDGPIADTARVRYLEGHLRTLADAIADGIDIQGYFCWSLLDNFEWAHGTAVRFGLVHVDFTTQRRTPKASFAWYRDFLRAQRAQHADA